jgi:hypothetical protein
MDREAIERGEESREGFQSERGEPTQGAAGTAREVGKSSPRNHPEAQSPKGVGRFRGFS